MNKIYEELKKRNSGLSLDRGVGKAAPFLFKELALNLELKMSRSWWGK
jgi:hypothetical protein